MEGSAQAKTSKYFINGDCDEIDRWLLLQSDSILL